MKFPTSEPTCLGEGVEYHRAFAAERTHIGRGLIAISLLLAGLLFFGFVTAHGAALLDKEMGRINPTVGGTEITPLYQAGNLIALALMIPWSMLLQRCLYGLSPGSLHSVCGRVRYDLLGRAILFVGPIWLLVVVSSAALPDTQVTWSTSDLIAMFAVTILLTPLQAAGEEYGLRGLVFRIAGSWSQRPRTGLMVGIVVSSMVFVVIHLSPDPWLNLYYLAPAVSFAIITWRTGGLEVAVAVHALNNTLLFLYDLVLHSDFPSLQERSAGGGTAYLLIPAGAVLAVAGIVWIRTRLSGPTLSPSPKNSFDPDLRPPA